MTEIITRCPGCSVSFRAMPAHLQAANGLVRCGACLLVFDARENLVANPLGTAPTEESDQQDDELLIHDDMDSDLLSEEQVQSPQGETSDLFSLDEQQTTTDLSLEDAALEEAFMSPEVTMAAFKAHSYPRLGAYLMFIGMLLTFIAFFVGKKEAKS